MTPFRRLARLPLVAFGTLLMSGGYLVVQALGIAGAVLGLLALGGWVGLALLGAAVGR